MILGVFMLVLALSRLGLVGVRGDRNPMARVVGMNLAAGVLIGAAAIQIQSPDLLVAAVWSMAVSLAIDLTRIRLLKPTSGWARISIVVLWIYWIPFICNAFIWNPLVHPEDLAFVWMLLVGAGIVPLFFYGVAKLIGWIAAGFRTPKVAPPPPPTRATE